MLLQYIAAVTPVPQDNQVALLQHLLIASMKTSSIPKTHGCSISISDNPALREELLRLGATPMHLPSPIPDHAD